MGSADDSFCLKWNDFHTSVTASFADLRSEADLFDVTLFCEGRQMQAHRLILSACSAVFKKMLRSSKHRDPTILLWDIRYEDMEALLNFMYHGEVNITQEKLNHFLDLAERLQVRGLTSGGGEKEKKQSQAPNPLRKVVLPNTPLTPSALGASTSGGGSNPPPLKRARLPLLMPPAAAAAEEHHEVKEETDDGIEGGGGGHGGGGHGGGIGGDGPDGADENSNASDGFAPPVVTEMHTGDNTSDFDSSAYLDNDDDPSTAGDRGGIPMLPQFMQEPPGGPGLNTNQVEPIIGPDGSKGKSVVVVIVACSDFTWLLICA